MIHEPPFRCEHHETHRQSFPLDPFQRKGRINILPGPPMRILLSIAVAALLTAIVNGQSPSSTSPASPARSSSPSSAAVVVPGTSTHTYLGCYNETTGDASTGNRRALADGTMVYTSI